MNKSKYVILSVLVLVSFLVVLQLKNKEAKQAALTQETHQVMEGLMRELYAGKTLKIPADGLWYKRMAFDHDLRLRRQVKSPDVLDVQIRAKNDASLISHLRMKIPQ